MRIFELPPALSFTWSILFLTPSYLFPHAEAQSSRSIHRYSSYVPSGWRNEVFRGLTKCQAVPSEGSAVLCTTEVTASVSYAASVLSASLREVYMFCSACFVFVFVIVIVAARALHSARPKIKLFYSLRMLSAW